MSQGHISVREAPGWLPAVAAAHADGVATWTEGSLLVWRVTGGANNALYCVETGGQRYACKLCVDDERRRAAREYGVLCLLRVARLDIAPEPLWLDESCAVLPFPTVIYRWLPGESFASPLLQPQLAAVLQSYQRVHALRRRDYGGCGLFNAWFHWFDFAPYLAELRECLAEYGSWLATTVPDGGALRDRLARLVDDCTGVLTSAPVDPGRDRFPLRLCRVDPNLANVVYCEDGRLRWVDWEYSGWGDPALDLAELRWHAAFAGLSAAQHVWLRESYRRPNDDPSFEARIALWDRLLATRWPFLVLRWLWSEYNGPDRVRLTWPRTDPAGLCARLVRFIERAEHLANDA